MTDNNDVKLQSESSPESNMVPKERLDELIAQRQMLAQQNQVLQEVLRKAVPSQQTQHPVQESEDMLRLKEENPALYQRFRNQEQQTRRTNATMFQLMEDNDRRALIEEFGDEGKKYINRVEDKLNDLRGQGIHTYNRGQIFYHLKGQEAVTSSRAPKAPVQAEVPSQVNNLPSSNPVSASTTVSGSAAPQNRAASLEELEARLADVLL